MATEHVALLLAVAAAATTMLGWALVAVKRSWTPRSVGIALLASAAAMVIISVIELLPPGLRDPDTRGLTLLVFAAGVVAVPILSRLLNRWAPLLTPLESTAFLVMLALAIHNIPEGTVVYAATLVGVGTGVVTAIAIGLHNIPEGMAVATSVIAAGGSRRRALAYTSVSMLGELVGVVAMVALGQELSPRGATLVLSLVAGIMASLSLLEIGPAGLRLVRGGPDVATPATTSPSS
jgi:ZIP family zinc transporter